MSHLVSTLSCLLLAVSFAAAQRIGMGPCLRPPVQEDFQVTEYLGTWYDYAHYEVYFQRNSKCIQAEYGMLTEDSISVFNSAITFWGNNMSIEGSAVIHDPAVPAKLAVSFTNETEPEPNYWVLSTDYSSYAMVYSCDQKTSLLHFTTVWFLVRDYHVSESLKTEVLGKFQSLGIDTEPFVYTQHGPENGCE